MTHERYMKINRQIRYDRAAATGAQTKILCFIWSSQINAAAGQIGVEDVIDLHVTLQTYFRLVK